MSSLKNIENKLNMRSKILQFEEEMAKAPDIFRGDSEKCPLRHFFADGVYVREIFIPKGMLIVGKIHKHSHPNFLMLGRVSVVTESGGVEILEAPKYMISPANTKRIVYTHEDTLWVTVHVTKSTNLKDIEKEVILENYDALELSDKEVYAIQKIKEEGD